MTAASMACTVTLRRSRHLARASKGDGKELVETRCTLCHDLERVAVVKRPRQHWPAIVANMVARGATATPEEAGTIATYLAAQFGSD